MSFLYRPTPVVRLGGGRFSSRRSLNRWPGTVMHGIPLGGAVLGTAGPSGAAARMRRVMNVQPWLQTSGTMHGFTPNGLGGFLGQDDGSSIDWSSAGDISPTLPVTTTLDLTPPDLGLPAYSPNLPAAIGLSQPPAPSPVDTSMYSAPATLTPPAGSGPTGTGIPGTQPLNLQPAAPPNVLASAITSLTSAVKTLVSPAPSVAGAGYKALPGYGGQPVTSPVTWFSQPSAILPGVPNWAMLAIGVVAFAALTGGGYAAGRSGRSR